MKKLIEICLPLLALAVVCTALFMLFASFKQTHTRDHGEDVYKMVILDKDSDMGSVFLCFGSESQYYVKYKVQNGDGSWHYYEREVPRRVYRMYNVGDTVLQGFDASNGYMDFINDHDLGLCYEK